VWCVSRSLLSYESLRSWLLPGAGYRPDIRFNLLFWRWRRHNTRKQRGKRVFRIRKGFGVERILLNVSVLTHPVTDFAFRFSLTRGVRSVLRPHLHFHEKRRLSIKKHPQNLSTITLHPLFRSILHKINVTGVCSQNKPEIK
jgi:hypothetical protein